VLEAGQQVRHPSFGTGTVILDQGETVIGRYSKTRTLGGRSALATVFGLAGHFQSFDLSQLDDVPRKDLPDLIPFLRGMLAQSAAAGAGERRLRLQDAGRLAHGARHPPALLGTGLSR
jgi:hypothetical protein